MCPRGVQNGFPEASGGLLVARSRAGGPKGESEIRKKYSWSAPGAHLARLGAVLGSPPPQERPGEAPGAHFLKFFGSAGAEGPKGNMCYVFYCFRVSISMLFLVLCCLPCCAPGGVANMGKP